MTERFRDDHTANGGSPREKLAGRRGQRISVIGCFDHFGYRYDGAGRKVITALFQAVETPEGEFLCEHCHVQYADTMRAYDLRHGERVQFVAAVMSYKRRLPNCKDDGTMYETDFTLYHPTGIKPLDREVILPSLVGEAMLVKDEARPVAAEKPEASIAGMEEEDEEREGRDAQLTSTNDVASPSAPRICNEELPAVPASSRARRIDLLNELQRLADLHGGFGVVRAGLDFLIDEDE